MITLVIIWSIVFLLACSAVIALIWSIQNGQFSNLNAGARSIFDEDEPVGLMTDKFPGKKLEEKQTAAFPGKAPDLAEKVGKQSD